LSLLQRGKPFNLLLFLLLLQTGTFNWDVVVTKEKETHIYIYYWGNNYDRMSDNDDTDPDMSRLVFELGLDYEMQNSMLLAASKVFPLITLFINVNWEILTGFSIFFKWACS